MGGKIWGGWSPAGEGRLVESSSFVRKDKTGQNCRAPMTAVKKGHQEGRRMGQKY